MSCFGFIGFYQLFLNHPQFVNIEYNNPVRSEPAQPGIIMKSSMNFIERFMMVMVTAPPTHKQAKIMHVGDYQPATRPQYAKGF